MRQTDSVVTILMAVRDGGRFLPAQLASFAWQTHPDWRLWVSDDGSCDNTAALLRAFASRGHDLRLWSGPGQGASANFMSLIRRLDPDRAGWTAFSDQDDVWLPDRLSRGLAALGEGACGRAGLYCSRTWVVDQSLRRVRRSPPRRHAPGFRNALVQNIAAGNTILLNQPAARLAARAARMVGPVAMHDWWLYQLVTGAGGMVLHDDAPTVLYRQHRRNTFGRNTGVTARAARMRVLLGGGFRDWNRQNLDALGLLAPMLTEANRGLLADYTRACRAGPLAAAAAVRRCQLFRQTRAETMAIVCAAALGRL